VRSVGRKQPLEEKLRVATGQLPPSTENTRQGMPPIHSGAPQGRKRIRHGLERIHMVVMVIVAEVLTVCAVAAATVNVMRPLRPQLLLSRRPRRQRGRR